MPANTAPSDVCAASPATTDSTPAEANTVVPMLENDGNVVRIAAAPSTTTIAMASLRNTVTCVRIRRHLRSASVILSSPPPYTEIMRRSATMTRLVISQVTVATNTIRSA